MSPTAVHVVAESNGTGNATFEQQRTLLLAHMNRTGVSQTDLASKIGRTAKHVNRVLHGHAGTHELDYWAWTLGLEFHVTMRKRHDDG